MGSIITSKRARELKLVDVSFTPKVFSTAEQAAWNRLWNKLLSPPTLEMDKCDEYGQGEYPHRRRSLMARTKHVGRALKGSQRHLQDLVNDHPEYLNCLVYSASPSLSKQSLFMPSWVSPLKQDDYQEYYDEGFLAAVGQQQLESSLREFWPKNGPVWDALATVRLKDGSHGLTLLEAKSYVGELGGPSYVCGARGQSRDKIVRSLDMVKNALGVRGDHDWLGEYYQFANRLAHLYFFHSIAKVPAWLVYLHFVGDTAQKGPLTVVEWLEPISRLKDQLGLPPDHILSERIITVFAPVFRNAPSIRE